MKVRISVIAASLLGALGFNQGVHSASLSELLLPWSHTTNAVANTAGFIIPEDVPTTQAKLPISQPLAGDGDTVVVQTLTFDSVGRAGVFPFPDSLSLSGFRQVLMQYRMRCHNALVSDGNNRNKGCGEWDYNCETYITDSSRVDSVHVLTPSYSISNPPAVTLVGGNFPASTVPVQNRVRRTEYRTSYTTVPDFTQATVGNEVVQLRHPFSVATGTLGRSLYIIRASELKAAGLVAGPLQGLRLKTSAPSANISELMVRLDSTKATTLTPTLVAGLASDTSLKTCYYSSGSAAGGGASMISLYFYQPFVWNGNSNLVVEFSYTNPSALPAITVTGSPTSYVSAATAQAMASSPAVPASSSLSFSGAEVLPVNAGASNVFHSIARQITVSFWAYGDPVLLPGANTIACEGVDSQNNRQVNIHLPWGDNQVYWDCGAVGGSFDRINKAIPSALVAAGRWNHWAFTKDADAGTMKIYLNGTLWASDTGKHRSIDLERLNLGMGATSNVGYQGNLSQFSLWNKALDSASVLRVMNGGIAPGNSDFANVVAYYPLNEGRLDVLHDSSSNHLTSRLVGVPVWRASKGRDLHTSFVFDTLRPNITFIQLANAPAPTIAQVVSYDTVLEHPHSLLHYGVVRDDSIATIDTSYRWAAGKYYVRDEQGVKVDSFDVAANDTVRISSLAYYRKSPQKFEIMSFVTPYGINLDLGKNGKMWQFDVTDYLPILHGLRRLSVERGSTQEELDIRFLFIKGRPARNVLNIQQIWPMTEEPYQLILSNERYEPRRVYLDPAARGFKLRSMITGHGQEGEFITRNHYIDVDSKHYEWEVAKQCSDNPLYPQGGTWIYRRAGWCPGAPTELKEIELTGTVNPGDSVTIDYGVTTASGDSRYDPSNQLVSYGAPNFKVNAGVMEIKRPSDRTEFGRINPACDLPIVVIQNNGSDPLKSLRVEYYVDGGPHRVFNWTGNLGFLDTESVELPVDSLGFWTTATTGTFHVDLSQPNGAADEYDADSHYSSTYTQPPQFTGAVVLQFTANKVPDENYYEIRDMSGATFISRNGFDAQKTFYDSLALPPGCYSLIFHDDGENGISFWAEPNAGNGSLRLRQNTKTGKILNTFNPDFGAFIQYDFSIAPTPLGVGESAPTSIRRMSVYPNPARDRMRLELDGFPREMVTLEIVDAAGRVERREQRFTNDTGALEADLDLHQFTSGAHLLRVTDANGSTTHPFIVE